MNITRKDSTFIFDFGEGVPSCIYTLTSKHPLYEEFAAYGFMEKLRNAANAAPTPEKAREKVRKLLESFSDGHWTTRDPDKLRKESLLVQALVHITKAPVSVVKAQLAQYSREEREELKGNTRVAQEIAKLRMEQISSKAELDTPILEKFCQQVGGN